MILIGDKENFKLTFYINKLIKRSHFNQISLFEMKKARNKHWEDNRAEVYVNQGKRNSHTSSFQSFFCIGHFFNKSF